MLDVEEGKVVEFGEPEAYVDYLVGKWASWNHDESEVFCFGGIRGKRDRQWAYLIKTATGEVKDWSEEWTRIMGDKSAYLEEYRTHDNRYIIVNVYGESGSFLFNPRTGIAINPKKQICQMLNMEETDSPRLFYLPKAGWVGVIAIGLNNSTNDWGAPKYAVDYNLNTSVLLFDNHGAWNISFDGKQAAAVFRDRDLPGLVIHKLFENEEL